MPNTTEFRDLAKQHLKTAGVLMDAGDWPGAGYMLGYVLEFALKAAACKTLNMVSYPENHKSEKVYNFFKSHNFDQLLMVSGLLDLFDTRGSAEAQRNWSEFTGSYLGEWTGMRYNKELRKQFDANKVKSLYNNLIDPADGILTVIKNTRRW